MCQLNSSCPSVKGKKKPHRKFLQISTRAKDELSHYKGQKSYKKFSTQFPTNVWWDEMTLTTVYVQQVKGQLLCDIKIVCLNLFLAITQPHNSETEADFTFGWMIGWKMWRLHGSSLLLGWTCMWSVRVFRFLQPLCSNIHIWSAVVLSRLQLSGNSDKILSAKHIYKELTRLDHCSPLFLLPPYICMSVNFDAAWLWSSLFHFFFSPC